MNPIDLSYHLIDAHHFEGAAVDQLESADLRTLHWEDHEHNAYAHHHRPEALG